LSQRVVAHHLDGRIVKGLCLDVDAGKPRCHVRPPGGAPVEVTLSELKAMYFVHTLAGDPAHHESVRTDPRDPRAHGSTLVSVRFADGETLIGYTKKCPPDQSFFFVMPTDRESNNIRILVNRDAAISIEPVARP
jgi:hypothetical protein